MPLIDIEFLTDGGQPAALTALRCAAFCEWVHARYAPMTKR